MTQRGHLPPIEDPLVPERSLGRPDRARGRRITSRSRCRPSPRTRGSAPSRPRARATSSLVWRRFRKSVPGMIGLRAWWRCCSSSRSSPTSSRRWIRTSRDVAFAPPDKISWYVPDQGWRLTPVAFPTTETDELDPVTFQPMIGPDFANPRPIRFFVQGLGLQALRPDPDEPALHRPRRRHAAAHPRHRQARPRHLLPRHRRLADLARHRAVLDRAHHRSSAR